MIFLCNNLYSNAALSRPLHSHSGLHPNLDPLQYPFDKYFNAKFSGDTIPIISEKKVIAYRLLLHTTHTTRHIRYMSNL